MGLREKQSIFALNFAKLVIYAYEIGYEVTLGEAQRTIDQQRLYFEGYTLLKVGNSLKLAKTTPKSKTMDGLHLKKLAVDINLFKSGELLNDQESFRPLAEYWKSLHPDNESGYDWGWDTSHFQMNK